jgi:hypothetical protein
MARVIREYDAQGIHRTGTAVDTASARWLADLVREAGCEASLEALPFERIDTRQAFLEVNGADGRTARYDGIPLIDSAEYTGAKGIEGVLGAPHGEADIVVARFPPGVEQLPWFRSLRSSDANRALVVVTGGGEFDLPGDAPYRASFPPGYALINADRYLGPYGNPVLQLPSETGPALIEARERGATARLVVDVERTSVEVYNVTTLVRGTDPSAAPLVVMTPRSGWWESASERGGGIALWLELLHALRATPPRRTVHFVASTGHELGHVGLNHYLEERRDLISGAHLWLHLGANFAAAVGGNVRLQASSSALLERALAAMQASGTAPGVTTPIGSRPFGEARNIHDGNGRYLSLLGSNGLFHSPKDRWPESVDMDTLEKLTRAFVGLMLEAESIRNPQ